MIEGRATSRYVRTSAQKAGLVLDLIRGRDVNTALATLRFARKGVAKDIEKALRSAVANASQRDGGSGDVDRLYVGACHADQGPSMKRIRAAPMGRAFRIVKRTAHLTVVVRERPESTTVVTVGEPAGAEGGTTKRRKGASGARRATKRVKHKRSRKTARRTPSGAKSASGATTGAARAATKARGADTNTGKAPTAD